MNEEKTKEKILEEKAENEEGDVNIVHNHDQEEMSETKEKLTPIIRAQNLDFVYNPGKGNEFHALINISLDIYPEEFIIIFGPSGCGKSTLLNVIAGLETPDKGSIHVFGQNLTDMDSHDFAVYHRKEVGMIYQSYNLITSLTVLENVVLPQVFVNVKKGRRKRWGRELLKRFGIFEHADKIPTELSGGQQQRIGIARAIVNNPKIVLADEPVGNLDSNSAKLVLSILGDLNEKEKKTIILVTHNPEYLDYADRILYMKDGIITREVVNRNKESNKEINKPKTVVKEINELMRAYQGMTPEQINILIMPFKSKIFANHFISSRNMEESKIFEEAIQRRMLGTISEDEFFDVLDKTSREGGVGFDRRTAKKIVRRINRVIRMAYYVYQKGHQGKDESGEHKRISFEEKAEKVKVYLYKTCYYEYYKHLNDKQDDRMKRAIKDRLMATMDKNSFYDYLDKPFRDGGVGLNSKTAKIISEELELILILGFGVVGVSEKMAVMSREERNIEKAKKEGLDIPISTAEKIVQEIDAERNNKHNSEIDSSSPGDILNQMKNQLDQEVKTVDDDKSEDKNNDIHLLSEENDSVNEKNEKLEDGLHKIEESKINNSNLEINKDDKYN